MKLFILFICFLFLTSFSSATNSQKKLLLELDEAILNEDEYTARKDIYIDELRKQLHDHSLTKDEQYVFYLNLAKVYETYRCDSTIVYVHKALYAAKNVGNKKWINDCMIQWARSEAKAGMLSKAGTILDEITLEELDKEQLIDFYMTYVQYCIFSIEYQDEYDINDLLKKKKDFQDALLKIAAPQSFEYVYTLALYYTDQEQYEKAEKVLVEYLPNIRPNTKEMAKICSLLSYVYQLLNDTDKQKEYLIISAIADIKASVKENISLRELATILYKENDLVRANSYIKKSMEDANFYNARLRNIQISKVLPIINEAYQLNVDNQRYKLRVLLITVSLLSAILLTVIIVVVLQIKKLSTAKKCIEGVNVQLSNLNQELKVMNEKQTQTNKYLLESNNIKEFFISSFLEISMEYIEKHRAFKQFVYRKIKTEQIADVMKLVSKEDTEKEYKELYVNFDNVFLGIYPTFVEEFNDLLRPEERYSLTEEKLLNHELRVFALIKLGIKDTNRITSFLNYAPRTVYNYRSKVKNKALNVNEDFEEKVKNLCSDKNV